VADYNRFDARGADSDLTVVSVPAALAGRSAIRGNVPAGGFRSCRRRRHPLTSRVDVHEPSAHEFCLADGQPKTIKVARST